MTTILMVILGLLTHFLKDLIRIKQEEGAPPNIIKYWKDNPYQTLLSIVGALSGYFALLETGQLTALTAFGIGYMANSVADVLGKRALNKIE